MKRHFLTICATLFIAGCGEQLADGPPAVRYGQDECAHCGMIVTDERHAAAITTVAGDGTSDYLAFDDIGDLIDYEREHPELKVHRRYVHDLKSKSWVEASAATIVHSPELHTPMGSGLAAFATPAAASGGIAGAKVMDWANAVQFRSAASAARGSGENGQTVSTDGENKPCCPGGHDAPESASHSSAGR
jgi:copper chaperone NosL